MALSPIPVVTFQTSIEPNAPPSASRPAEPGSKSSQQDQVQNLEQLPTNQIPTQAPGLFGLALALENFDQRDQTFVQENLPASPSSRSYSSPATPATLFSPNPPASPGGTQPAATGQAPNPAQPGKGSARPNPAALNPGQASGQLLNLFA